eukprot:2018847-Rhodomonas_salina.1
MHIATSQRLAGGQKLESLSKSRKQVDAAREEVRRERSQREHATTRKGAAAISDGAESVAREERRRRRRASGGGSRGRDGGSADGLVVERSPASEAHPLQSLSARISKNMIG